ncbi:MAG TPA: hypothetical protein DCM10_07350 [Xanthomarina gelatinilytica]|nr:hypothetical protein [Xanthomarina gelatinilytica]|tara:strand:+ start:473 stop:856 length:384 start_codon:yes stop_codon:yes gene_type:complete
MSAKIVLASDNFVREIQTYKECYVWLNFDNRDGFIEETFKREDFDIFGILSKGMTFYDENSAEVIVKIFESKKNLACIITQETYNDVNCIFINTNLTGLSIDTEQIINNEEWETLYIEGLVKIHGKA